MSIIPYDITPYQQTITWYRYEIARIRKFWDVQFRGSWDVHFMWFIFTYQESLRTMTKSYVDGIINRDSKYVYPHWWSDWQYNKLTQYEDPMYSFKPLEFVFDMSQPYWIWYGQRNFYTWWVFSNIIYGPLGYPDPKSDPILKDLAWEKENTTSTIKQDIPIVGPYLWDWFFPKPKPEEAPKEEVKPDEDWWYY